MLVSWFWNLACYHTIHFEWMLSNSGLYVTANGPLGTIRFCTGLIQSVYFSIFTREVSKWVLYDYVNMIWHVFLRSTSTFQVMKSKTSLRLFVTLICPGSIYMPNSWHYIWLKWQWIKLGDFDGVSQGTDDMAYGSVSKCEPFRHVRV